MNLDNVEPYSHVSLPTLWAQLVGGLKEREAGQLEANEAYSTETESNAATPRPWMGML